MRIVPAVLRGDASGANMCYVLRAGPLWGGGVWKMAKSVNAMF